MKKRARDLEKRANLQLMQLGQQYAFLEQSQPNLHLQHLHMIIQATKNARDEQGICE